MSSDVTRAQLFEQLLLSSDRIEQFKSLSQLLQVWPPLDAFQYVALVTLSLFYLQCSCELELLKVGGRSSAPCEPAPEEVCRDAWSQE